LVDDLGLKLALARSTRSAAILPAHLTNAPPGSQGSRAYNCSSRRAGARQLAFENGFPKKKLSGKMIQPHRHLAMGDGAACAHTRHTHKHATGRRTPTSAARLLSFALVPGAYLWFGNDERAQAVVTNGSRHGQHAHHANAIPKQNLAPCCLHPSLHIRRIGLSTRDHSQHPCHKATKHGKLSAESRGNTHTPQVSQSPQRPCLHSTQHLQGGKDAAGRTVSSSLAALWSSVSGIATLPRQSTARESPAHGPPHEYKHC